MALVASHVVLPKLKLNLEAIKKKNQTNLLYSTSSKSWSVTRRVLVSPVAAAGYQPRKPPREPKAKGHGLKEQKWVHEGVITESLPNGMFRVRLDNEDVILGHVSGKIRQNFIRILPGDKVQIEVSRYDSTRGRIIFRK